MLNNMFRGFQGERWCREFRTVFQEGSELVLFCKRHNVAEAHRDLFDHSLNDSEVVGAEESLVFEIHEEVMGSQESAPIIGLWTSATWKSQLYLSWLIRSSMRRVP